MHFIRLLSQKMPWCLALALCVATTALAQKKALKRADALYKARHFAEAAALYEQALESRPSIGLMTRLATCYRMTNRYDEAARLLEQVVQHERARPATWLDYAETLMYQQRYSEALAWARRYLEAEPDNARAHLIEQACLAVGSIEPLFSEAEIRPFAWNSPADELSPVFFDGGLVFTSDRNQGLRLLKEKSGWTGRDYLQLWFAERQDDTTFAEPRPYDARLNELNHHCGMASFTADGSTVYFTRTSTLPARNGEYHLQLFVAQRSPAGKWKQPEVLPFCSPEYNYMHPALSPGGDTLFFVSDKGRGKGGTDIWMSIRTAHGWSRPVPVEAINTAAHEAFPFVARTGELYFCSRGHPGFGGFDIFVTRHRPDGSWAPPRNLGPPVNSPYDDITFFLAPDGRHGAFTSARHGSDDIFLLWVGE